MAERGWYPDPGGAAGRYRYWDGSRWSAETTSDPQSPPPSVRPGPASQGTSGKITSRLPLVIAGVAVLLVIALISLLVIRSRRPDVLTDPNPPAPSVSGWNDSSPLPTADPTPSPTPPPTQSPSPSGLPRGQVACAQGDPWDARQHPTDGRIHGGDLSITQPGGDWDRDDDYAQQMTWAYDVAGADEWVEPHWLAMVAVGAVHADDGFRSPKQSADGLMQCIASSAYYRYFTGRTDRFARAVTVDGHRGWALRSEVRVDNPDVRAEGDVVEVIVLNTGRSGELSFFAGFIPIGDHDRLAVLDSTIAGIRVD
ncbi:DUF2510 domain-containing protein [Microlunatus sp. Gsoil 973]|uniref:DUF2510 domain-containing protein n=1 Tax=Microlunatus sp. Gsoil 973 TaxID=2672569 RepID=UPI0018A818F0|nr:DUF2510 domain-containing protein [Microlunatus sp. Gsoil 973]